MRWLVAVTALTLLAAAVSDAYLVRSANADGQLAVGFGANGVMVDGAISSTFPVYVADVIDDSRGRLVVAGTIATNAVGTPFVARYLRDGRRDPSFGMNGFVTVAHDSFSTAVANLPDGSIVVSIDGSNSQGTYRISPDGVSVTLLSLLPVVTSLIKLPDGKLLGVRRGDGFVFRLLPSLSVDQSFSTVVPVPPPGLASGLQQGDPVIFPDGRILVATGFAAGMESECRLTAYESTGLIDRSFGTNGDLSFDGFGSCNLLLLPDGRLVVHRFSYPGPSIESSIYIDDRGGVMSTLANLGPAPYHHITVEGQGRIIATNDTFERAFSLDGSIDTTFGTLGDIAFPGFISGVRALETGDIVVWGNETSGSSSITLQLLDSPHGVASRPPAVSASKFVPVLPDRILDTRTGLGAPMGKVSTNGQIDLKVTGVGGVPPSDVSAIVLNVTATQPDAPGYVSAFPTGGRPPLVSNLNIEWANQTAPNLVTVRVGAGGSITLFSLSATHLIVDVAGYYTPVESSSDGRFVSALPPTRLLDTREGLGAQLAKVPAGGQIDLQILGVEPIPATGVAAVVLNLTATEATNAGFITVWPTGSARPTVSNLNIEANETRPNLVVVPVGLNGKVSIYSLGGAHLVADVFGWFTDESAVTSSGGLFVPLNPTRILDTRDRASNPLTAGTVLSMRVAGTTLVPPNAAAAVVVNMTVTESGGPGFLTVTPSAIGTQSVSNLNYMRPSQTIANASIVPVNVDSLDIFTLAATHVVADIAGWYTLH
jgi:hypothetical protein